MYSGRTTGGRTFVFGTSGLLYRSNKLMFETQTYSLWSNLTGEPVVGKFVGSGLRLKVLPFTVTSWKEWRDAHPATTVLKLDQDLGAKWGFKYEPGAADRARKDVWFPIWVKNKILPDKAEVYGVRVADHAKAYPMDLLVKQSLIHDQIGETPVVIVTNPSSGAVRIYERSNHTFRLAPARKLLDEEGRAWKISEEYLIAENGSHRLNRIPGHLSLWFAWYGFFPHTTIFSTKSQSTQR